MNEKDGIITVTNENNETIKVQVIFGFEVPELKKKYVVYTTNFDDDNIVNVLISEIDYDTFEIKEIPKEEADIVMEFYNNAKKILLEEE